MKAFILDRYGSKVPLRLGEMADPEVREDEVLVQVHAAAINQLDSKIRSGEFKLILPYRTPFVLGHDLAGVVVRVGAGATQFKVGDEVYARPADHHIGTFAELIAVRERDLALKPERLTMVEAASMPLVGLTAWQALVERGRLERGQKVFIQAGSGGVGTIAIQLAKHLGATVATTTSASSFDLVRGLGADVVVDYKKEDLEARLNGYDLVLHSQDAKTLEKSLRVLHAGGRLVSISGPPDPAFGEEIGAPFYVKLFMRMLSSGTRRKARSLDVGFSFLFMKASGAQLRELAKLVDAGAVRPVVDRVFPFESTNEALAYVDTGRAKGKVVIKVRS